jgi:hypothetical protein
MMSRSIPQNIPVVIIFFISLFLSVNLVAQTDLYAESAKMQRAYKNPAYLSFDVKYTYALDSDPTAIIDSSFGSFKISGKFYWGMSDSTEYMQNSSYSVVLFRGDKLMRVSNPATVYPEVANFSSIDSLIGKNNYITNLSTSGPNRVIDMTVYDLNYHFKSMQISYDSVTNFVKSISYTIREDFYDYPDKYSRPTDGNESDYVIIKATYSNYSTSAFSTTIFNSSNYFILSENSYVPQPPFSDYEVFIASPNLIK